MKRLGFSAVVLTLLLLTTACSKFQRIRQNPNFQAQIKAAYEYYEEEDYYRAALLFQDLIPLYRGRPESQKMQFTYAYCHYHEGDYLLASHYFRTYFDTYRRSERAEEALYRSSESLCFDAPDPELDQASTREAIVALQGFINLFPNSEYAPEATRLLDLQQQKLESKAFQNANLYAKVGRHHAAIIAFENFESGFPDSRLREQAHYLRTKAAFDYADRSRLHKQEERFKKTIEYHEEFVDKYPESEFKRELDVIHQACVRGLERLSKQQAEIEAERKQAEERERRRRENLEEQEKNAALQQ
ncbi:MAG: outer membrane protein assembly factor BamD [Bacteroidota bacterium]